MVRCNIWMSQKGQSRQKHIIRNISTFKINHFIYCYRSGTEDTCWGKRSRKLVRWIWVLHVFFPNSNNQHIHRPDIWFSNVHWTHKFLFPHAATQTAPSLTSHSSKNLWVLQKLQHKVHVQKARWEPLACSCRQTGFQTWSQSEFRGSGNTCFWDQQHDQTEADPSRGK